MIPALAAALLAGGLFAVSVGGTYIYDDIPILLNDPRLPDPAKWGYFWTESYNFGVDNLYRPLVSISYAIQWWIHGDSPWAFHLVNVLLHMGVSACVAELARRLLGWRGGLAAGLLFAAHPIHVEAVANIVGRAEVACGLGFFGAMLLFTRPLTVGRSFAIVGCFILSVLSKEQGMLLPPILLAMALLPISPPGQSLPAMDAQTQKQRRDAGTILLVMLSWLLAAYILFRESTLKFWWDRSQLDWTFNPLAPTATNPFGIAVGWHGWLVPITFLGRYVWLLLFPLKLSLDYSAFVISPRAEATDPFLYIGLAAFVAGLLIMAIGFRKRCNVIVLASLGFAMTFGLVSNFISLIGINFAERLMYIPSGFFVILIAAMLSRLPRNAYATILLIAVCLGATRTFTYAGRWNDRLAFYRISLAEQPRSIRLHLLLANEYRLRGDLDKALAVAEEGCALAPTYWQAWMHRGMVAMDQQDYVNANLYLSKAMSLDPNLMIQGRFDELHKRTAAAQPTTTPAPASTNVSGN